MLRLREKIIEFLFFVKLFWRLLRKIQVTYPHYWSGKLYPYYADYQPSRFHQLLYAEKIIIDIRPESHYCPHDRSPLLVSSPDLLKEFKMIARYDNLLLSNMVLKYLKTLPKKQHAQIAVYYGIEPTKFTEYVAGLREGFAGLDWDEPGRPSPEVYKWAREQYNNGREIDDKFISEFKEKLEAEGRDARHPSKKLRDVTRYKPKSKP